MRWIASLILVFTASTISAEDTAQQRFANGVQPFLKLFAGETTPYTVSGQIDAHIDGRSQQVELSFSRFDDQSFDLSLTHADYSVAIRRRADATAFALPHHRIVYTGTGDVDASESLQPLHALSRLISSDSVANTYLPLLKQGSQLAPLVMTLLQGKFSAEDETFRFGKSVTCRFETDPATIDVTVDQHQLRLQLTSADTAADVTDWTDWEAVKLDRAELERTLSRGMRRITEILAPGVSLTSPQQTSRRAEHGELRWVEGQRVCLLQGTPEEIGRAHGELLKEEAQRCIDSVLYAFGTVQTIRTGRWFRNDLEAAYARLEPHIPERHLHENAALADSLGLSRDLVQALNVFPELFHCSGFAVFGSATADGKLYHGRVLDYMTTIGLQDAATTFIVAPQNQHAFANVGYAGFTGSVSGMNAVGISLGEMGGRGEGQWDGAPMATLMRRALEECTTLDEVMDLWKSSPRTCEYYYVFADGKTNRAVGVAAVPESVEFILPGQTHERLGPGIPDAVVLSAGSRLEKLRERVQEKHGTIDAQLGQWLMSRPVAMQSNLHNVLFVPVDGDLYVANADHKRPAAECHYVHLNLPELLASMSVTGDENQRTEATKAVTPK